MSSDHHRLSERPLSQPPSDLNTCPVPCCRSSTLAGALLVYAGGLLFLLVTEETTSTTDNNPLARLARIMLLWRSLTILVVLLGYRVLSRMECSTRSCRSSEELLRQSRTGIFPSWSRRAGPTLEQATVFSQELGEERVPIDSEPHILLTVRWWNEQCQRLVVEACTNGVNVVVLVPNVEIATQVHDGNKRLDEENVLGRSAGLYIVVDEHGAMHHFERKALSSVARTPCRCLCVSYVVRGFLFHRLRDYIEDGS